MSAPLVRPEILGSWRRAALYNVDPRQPLPSSVGEVDRSSRLLHTAGPLIDELYLQVADHPLCLVLGDHDCRVVQMWTGDRRLRAALEEGGVVVGMGLDESIAGTNGVGTPVETGRGTSINGTEHYLELLKGFSCVGIPIRHPLTGRAVGVLDATVRGESLSPLFTPLLERVVKDIEAAFVDSARENERRIFRAFQSVARRRAVPVAAVGTDVVLANRRCLERLGAAGPDILRLLLEDVPATGRAALELDLGPAGKLAVEAERIQGSRDGALFVLTGAAADTIPVRPVRWTHHQHHSVLISGEPGTGRTAEAYGRTDGASCSVLDATESITVPERVWAARLAEAAASSVPVLIVEDVHVLSQNLSMVLRRLMATPTAPMFVLTSCPVAELPGPARSLAGACVERVELRPLRHRLHELPALITRMSEARGMQRPLRLTARAVESLAAHPWPGNLAELARLVDELSSRPALEPISPADLPDGYRASPRASGLGGREQAERNAIMNALRITGGNRRRAAEQLGISRTTLYRRMAALDVGMAPTENGATWPNGAGE